MKLFIGVIIQFYSSNMKTLSTFLLAFALTQAVSAATVPELIEEYKSIVDNRVSEVGQLIGMVGRDVGLTFGQIQKNINDVSQNLNDEIDNIKNLANSSLSRASELGQNIEECVSAATSGVSSLNLDALQKCSVSNELTEVQKLIPQLASIPRQLGTLIPRCMVGLMKDAETIRSCLSDGLQGIDDAVNSLNASARMLVDRAIASAEECVEGAISEADSVITNSKNALNDCVNNNLSS